MNTKEAYFHHLNRIEAELNKLHSLYTVLCHVLSDPLCSCAASIISEAEREMDSALDHLRGLELTFETPKKTSLKG